MLKMLTAIMTAAAIAAVATVISAPGPVDAGPLAQPNEAVLKVCTQKAWPYLNFVGNPRIRLITTDRIAP